MQEAPLSQLCDSDPFPMAARFLNFFLYALLFQLLFFLSLDYTLCPPPRRATSTQFRPLSCTKDTYEGREQAQVDSTHPALDVLALAAAPSSASSNEESEEEEEEEVEDEEEPNVLTIVY